MNDPLPDISRLARALDPPSPSIPRLVSLAAFHIWIKNEYEVIFPAGKKSPRLVICPPGYEHMTVGIKVLYPAKGETVPDFTRGLLIYRPSDLIDAYLIFNSEVTHVLSCRYSQGWRAIRPQIMQDAQPCTVPMYWVPRHLLKTQKLRKAAQCKLRLKEGKSSEC